MSTRKETGMAVLLVDDEYSLRQTLTRSLAARGYHVEAVGTGAEAISATRTQKWDLMVLDINLPDATGWDVLRWMDADGCTVPVVVFSAVPPSAQRVKEFQPYGVLQKPFPIDALVRLVEQVREERDA
jgi:DNA-binding response OmpR family regulator